MKSSRKSNGKRRKRSARPRQKLGNRTPVVSYVKAYGTSVNQWADMTLPYFSGLGLLNSLSDTERKASSIVDVAPRTTIVRISQIAERVHTYRILVFHFPERLDWDVHAILPLDIFKENPSTTNFWYLPTVLLKDQPVKFEVKYDRTFIMDTNVGKDRLIRSISIRVPSHRVVFDTDDTDGRTARGFMVLAILTDADDTTAGFTYQISTHYRFKFNL